MIWIIGDRGMLGTELREALRSVEREFVGSDRECDVTSPEALAGFAAGKAIDWIVNCSAYTAVDKAEDEVELARRLNVEGPANIAALATRLGAKLVHISTDYVFSGEGTAPYEEDEPTDPKGVYGRTKAEGEEAVRRACSRHFILRTAWLYGRHGPNFVYTMLKLMRERDSIGVVADQRGSPTWAADLTAAILRLVDLEAEDFGTYHFTDEGETSWHEFALAIQDLGFQRGLITKRIPIAALTTEQYPTKARRPAYSVLSKTKIREALGCATPDWRASLAAFLDDLARNGLPAGR